MWPKWKLVVLLVVATLLSMIILRGTLSRKSELPGDGTSDAGSVWPRKESQSVQTKVEIRHTSPADKVRACVTV